jgi:hypothetical protein
MATTRQKAHTNAAPAVRNEEWLSAGITLWFFPIKRIELFFQTT